MHMSESSFSQNINISLQGQKGALGIRGDKGESGEKGAVGEAGDPGNTGGQGQKGDKGDPGPQGPAGPDSSKDGCACLRKSCISLVILPNAASVHCYVKSIYICYDYVRGHGYPCIHVFMNAIQCLLTLALIT